ncbi:rod shape-determining protein MreD [Defluviitalea phaphyphila]|uniref:rod shape-determining protein MreD n=1 Tax=Defluviitalea phaphyphila TaxID=1473580 RepID=UPI00073180E3|nr:rod shape-determining protein MreD [Defluviitalea phaphyphila]
MRAFCIALILTITNVLQSTYFQHIRIRGTIPNIFITIIISFALLRGEKEGGIVGFFAGLIQDIYFGMALGFNTLLCMYIGYFCGKLNKKFYRENFLLPIILTVVSTIFYDLNIYIFSYLVRGKVDFKFFLNNIIIPEAVYTGVISILVYQGIYYLNKKLELREQKYKKLFKL